MKEICPRIAEESGVLGARLNSMCPHIQAGQEYFETPDCELKNLNRAPKLEVCKSGARLILRAAPARNYWSFYLTYISYCLQFQMLILA